MGIPNLDNQQTELFWGSGTPACCVQLLLAWPMCHFCKLCEGRGNDQRSSCCGEVGRASAGLERELGGFGVLMKTSYWGLALRAVYASSE